jgi:hypothetical protein
MCIPQHKVNDLNRETEGECVSRSDVFYSKYGLEIERRWNFQEKINAKGDASFEDDVENLLKKLKERLLEVKDEVCCRTKGPLRHRESWRWNEEWQSDRWKQEIVQDVEVV